MDEPIEKSGYRISMNGLWLMRCLVQCSPLQAIVSLTTDYTDRFLSLSAFAMTETELKLIAAAAIIGLNRTPKKG